MRKNTKIKKKVIKKRKRLVPLPTLKKKLWQTFSVFIRLRDADSNGMCKCCTSGKLIPWTASQGGAQSGHYFCQRGNPMLVFCETNVHAQSPIENKKQRNNITWDYTEFMLEKYGLEHIRKLAAMRGKPFKFTRPWLEEKLSYYSKKVEQLKKEKNL